MDRYISSSSLSESLLFQSNEVNSGSPLLKPKANSAIISVTTRNIGGTLLIASRFHRDGITPRHFASRTALVQTPIERHSSAPFIGFPWSLRARSFHWPAALKCDALKEDRLFSPVLAQNRFFLPLPFPSLFFFFLFRNFQHDFRLVYFPFFFFFIIYERSNVFCGVKSIDRFYDSFIFGEAVFYSFLSLFFSPLPFPRLSGCTRCLRKVFL